MIFYMLMNLSRLLANMCSLAVVILFLYYINSVILTFVSSALQRVKVYRLNDDGKWDDQGTGHVTVDYIEVSVCGIFDVQLIPFCLCREITCHLH